MAASPFRGILRLVPQNAMLENVCLAPLKSAEN
jgi:hypothetical protein